MSEEEVRAKMRKAFDAPLWSGVPHREEAFAAALRYRDSLKPEARTVYDEQIMAGCQPGDALEVVEWLQREGKLPAAQPEKLVGVS